MSIPPVKNIPVDLIRPGHEQARKLFKAEPLQELAESIRQSGIVQPLVLRQTVWGYQILAGERRWRAAQLVGVHEVPAIIRNDLSDEEAFILGLVENLQRENLSPIEAAAGMKRLADLQGLTHEQLAARIGKSRVYVTHILRLLHLNPAVQTLVDEGHISLGHAKVLSGLPEAEQPRWASEVIKKVLTVRALERRLASERNPLRAKSLKATDARHLERALADHFALPVTLQANRSGKGSLTIAFHSLDELDGLLARIGYSAE